MNNEENIQFVLNLLEESKKHAKDTGANDIVKQCSDRIKKLKKSIEKV